MAGFRFETTQVSRVIISERTRGMPALSILAALAVVNVDREILARIPVYAAVAGIIAPVDKNLMVTHVRLWSGISYISVVTECCRSVCC
jgi:hypothetical protein